jgi:hypothetical protein
LGNKPVNERRVGTPRNALIRFVLYFLAQFFQILAKPVGGFTPRQRHTKCHHQQNRHSIADPSFHRPSSPAFVKRPSTQNNFVPTNAISGQVRRKVIFDKQAKYTETLTSRYKICSAAHPQK